MERPRPPTSDRSHVSAALLALGRETEPLLAYLKREIAIYAKASDNGREDELTEALKQLSDQSLRALRPALEKAVAKIDDDFSELRMPLLEVLLRAGAVSLPKSFHEGLVEERDLEQGGFGLDFDVSDASEQLTLARKYAAAAIIDKAFELCDGDDDATPLWPAEFAPERSHRGWFAMMSVSLNLFDERGAWEVVGNMLEKRLHPGDELAIDRRFALDFALVWSARDAEASQGLVSALLDAPEELLRLPKPARRGDDTDDTDDIDDSDDSDDSDESENIEALRAGLRRRSTLAQGWVKLKERRLREARVALNALLEDEPDGQVWFFEARLAWLETGKPEAAIALATKRLGEVSKSDRAGRGRLLNLIGCAYDEMKQYAEALPYFERAVSEGEGSAMYLANVAEILEKLGRLPEARAVAEQARASRDPQVLENEVVKRLLS